MSTWLEETPTGIQMIGCEHGSSPLRLMVDFINDKASYHKKHKGKKELIYRAVGTATKKVLDLTGGLLVDAFFLAQLGLQVTAVERNPLIYRLVEDSLKRALSGGSEIGQLKEALERIQLVQSDSLQYLKNIKDKDYEAIYLDPMYPMKKGTALARKSMRVFRMAVGDDLDSELLLARARQTSIPRVVVKRSIKAPPLAPGAIHSFKGTTVRFDLYAPYTTPDTTPA